MGAQLTAFTPVWGRVAGKNLVFQFHHSGENIRPSSSRLPHSVPNTFTAARGQGFGDDSAGNLPCERWGW